MTDWPDEMRRMRAARERVRAADTDELWRFEEPRPPADADRLREVAGRLGHELDRAYVSFLLAADGWPALFQDIDVFGTGELLGSPAMETARMLVDSMEPDALMRSGLARDALLPIAASTTTIDFFVMPVMPVMPMAPGDVVAPVIWIAGAEVERYPSFPDFFRHMIGMNLEEAEVLRAENDG
ncbi:SMI1/KNR4 family protein [Streptomyces flavochromogenes]|uniref:SMI1/KNR4 family protein n=1 Tax=Streptomyces flavochromogenes TaxID=68199 RepID=UPI0004C1B2E5|nr:SMI1/KNR4 family protein [Streptomyces flavochromogenes]